MWSFINMLSIIVCGITSLSIVVGKTDKRGYGSAGDMTCGAGKVFAITYFNDITERLEMRCVPPLICGKPGVKIGTTQNCLRDGEFMARANENGLQSGNIIESCNRYKLPPKDDYDQICVTLLVDDGEESRGGRRHRRNVLEGRARFENNLEKKMFISTHQKIERLKRAAMQNSKKTDIFVAKTNNGIQLSWYVKDIARQSTNYKVVGCLVVCRKSDERNDPKNPENSEFYDQYKSDGLGTGSYGGSGGGACFSADSALESMSGPMRMDQVKAGDKVMAYDAKLSIYVFVEVLYFIHREPAAVSDFVIIETEAGKTLTLTNKHLIPVGECDRNFEDSPEKIRQIHMEYMKSADQAHLGQCVMVKNHKNNPSFEKIVRLESKSQTGIFAPVTKEGNVIVNGVHASCYSEFGDYAALKGLFGVYHACLDVVENLVGTKWRAIGSSAAFNDVPLPHIMRLFMEAGKLFR